jgi:hypothetical protein
MVLVVMALVVTEGLLRGLMSIHWVADRLWGWGAVGTRIAVLSRSGIGGRIDGSRVVHPVLG